MKQTLVGILSFLFLAACSVSAPQFNTATTTRPSIFTPAFSPTLTRLPPPLITLPSSSSLPPTTTPFYSSLRAISATNAPNLQLLRNLSPAVESIAFSPDGNLIAASYDDGTILMWRIGSDEGLLTGLGIDKVVYEGNGKEITSIAFSPDGRRLASAGTYAGLLLRDIQSGQVASSLPARTSIIAFSPDGQTLAVSEWPDITLWNVSQATPISKLDIPDGKGGAVCIAFSPDGTKLAAGITDEYVMLWDVSNGYHPLRTINWLETSHPSHYRLVHVIAFSPDSKLIASGIDDQRVPIWETDTGELLRVLDTHTEETIKDPLTGELRTVGDVPEPVESLAFSPDGSILAIAAWNEVILKGIDDGGLVQKLVGPEGSRITRIAFSPNGNLLASGSSDGGLRIWAVALPK